MTKQGLLIMGGVLAGTIIRQQFGLIEVQYPYRKTKDLYLVLEPMETWERTIHCCYQECDSPDFEPHELLEHLVKHAGKEIGCELARQDAVLVCGGLDRVKSGND